LWSGDIPVIRKELLENRLGFGGKSQRKPVSGGLTNVEGDFRENWLNGHDY